MSTVYENPWFKVVRENGFHWVEENGASNGAELQEETGYRAAPEQLTRLGRYRPNSAILTSCVDLYLAELTSSDQVGRPDREVLAVEEVPLGSLPAKLQDGILDDGFTLAALAHYYARAQA
mgnify:CR=1 FL=1